MWVALKKVADWRWLNDSEDCPYYPTMRLFRRGHAEAKGVQMARIVKELKAQKKALMDRRQALLV